MVINQLIGFEGTIEFDNDQTDLYHEIIDKFIEISSDNDSSNDNDGIEHERMDNNKKFQWSMQILETVNKININNFIWK